MKPQESDQKKKRNRQPKPKMERNNPFVIVVDSIVVEVAEFD